MRPLGSLTNEELGKIHDVALSIACPSTGCSAKRNDYCNKDDEAPMNDSPLFHIRRTVAAANHVLYGRPLDG